MKRLLVAFALLACGAIVSAKDYGPVITIRVVTAEGVDAAGFVSPDLQDRRDSVKDLLFALFPDRRPVKHDGFLLQAATDTATPDVIVDVLGRERNSTNRGYRAVHLRVSAGSYTTAVDGSHDQGAWSGAASDAAHRLTEWIGNNRDRLIAARTQK